MNSRISALEIERAWSRLSSIADEADASVMRTAFSSIIRDSHDYSCAIYDGNGNLLSQPNFVSPGHLGGMSVAMRRLKEHFPFDTLKEGDVIITNDPWLVSGHLPDVLVTAPVFWRGKLVAFSACVFHHQDIGGRLGIDNREVFEEGLQIPPSLLLKAGEANDDLFRIIGRNVRVPDLVVNDIRSQVASVLFTGGRIQRLLEELGWDSLEGVVDEIFDRTEAAFRRNIREIPEGTYTSACAIETGVGDQVINLKLALEVKDGHITADFDGTDAQVAQGINCVLNYTMAYCLFALKTIVAPLLPNNIGALRPFTIKAPPGSILNARYPAPVVGRTSVGQYVPELVYQAFADVVPEKIIAASGSVPLWWLTLSGRQPDGRSFVIGPMFSGGLGARSTSDGVSCLTFPANIKNNPVEMIETDSPLIVERREFATDSGGAGEFRGGLGQEFILRVPEDDTTSDEATVQFLIAGRLKDRPSGVKGGMSGTQGSIELNGEAITWGKPYLLQRGDRICYRTPGGGGYGDPGQRDRDAVETDLRAGLISETAARDIYGAR